MGFLGQTFNTNELPENQGSFDPIPDGWYNATIESCELKDTSTGGKLLNFGYSITGPSFQGRKVFDNINIINKSQKAEEIGRSQMGDIMRAVGLPSVQDSDQFVGGPLQIKVRTQPAKDGYEARNIVKGWKAIESGTPAAAPQQQSQPQQQTTAKPPWAK